MPIYEYRRPDGTTFEIVQSFSEDSLTHDPETGVPVVRVLHAPALHFKGSGFYNTDYGTRKRQRENAAASSEESSAKKDSSADGGSADGSSKSADTDGGKAKSEKTSSSTESPKSKDAKPAAAKS